MRRTIHAALIASLAITADAFVAPSPSLSLAFPPHAVKCSAVRGLDLNLRAASSSKEGVKDEKETRAAKYWAEAEKAFTDVAVRKAKENMKRGPPASGNLSLRVCVFILNPTPHGGRASLTHCHSLLRLLALLLALLLARTLSCSLRRSRALSACQ
jgi:hypothetical protein